ncbi:MAG: RluA family pseudouridine synthase [Candidatus Taylorbacteria bacterium]|nr:RluA family pseudouridine synthase [Candidatus Taylorbacteria bacterium]
MDVPVLYEDIDLLVVNKPAGLVVHSDGKTKEPALTDWILEHYPEIKGVGEPTILSNGNMVDRPGIVHRLDRETSGVLVIAKNQKAFEFLKKQFQEREMEKTYRAFVYGEMKNDSGIIDRPIARSTGDFRKWTAERGRRGEEREAVTEYKVLARYDGFSFLDVHPKTGRTHQIRVHLKAISHPVVCDKLYASKKECALGFNRQALHAFSITFMLPSGKPITVEAPYPEDFKKALKYFE